MYYYKFNIADWHLATSHLSLEEEAIYFKLINYYYDSEQPIPQETQTVIRRLRLGSYMDTVQVILNEFFELSTDGWHHKRCDDEIQAYHLKAEKNQKVGKLGGRPKKIKDLDNNPTETQTVSENNPQETLTKNHKPLTNNQYTKEFDSFWNVYPNKVGKSEAFKSWKKIKPDEILFNEIIEGLKKYNRSKKVIEGYILNPSTWLNQKRWEDEVLENSVIEKPKELPLGTPEQIEYAYKVECKADPTKARFNSYQEMRKFIQDFRDKSKRALQ